MRFQLVKNRVTKLVLSDVLFTKRPAANLSSDLCPRSPRLAQGPPQSSGLGAMVHTLRKRRGAFSFLRDSSLSTKKSEAIAIPRTPVVRLGLLCGESR
jgi:hypothetical protein